MCTALRFSLLGLIVFLAACSLDRSVLSVSSGTAWDVQPPYFCPGEPVFVSWDFARMPKAPGNCRPPNGGYGALMSCVASAMCPADGACLDNRCCRRDLLGTNECDDGSGCYPDFALTVTGDTFGAEPVIDGEHRSISGTRQVMPSDTTLFTINASYNPPPRLLGESKTATIIHNRPATHAAIDFPFICTGGPGWAVRDFNRQPLATSHSRIAGVRNTTAFTIIVTVQDPPMGPITLHPGETTEVFNGRVIGLWSVRLSPLDHRTLVPPRCNPTDIADPWPDLQLDFHMECVKEE